MRAPLKSSEVKSEAGKPVAGSSGGTQENARADKQRADEEQGPESSDSETEVLVDRSLPSLFSPAARARSVIDVGCPINFRR